MVVQRVRYTHLTDTVLVDSGEGSEETGRAVQVALVDGDRLAGQPDEPFDVVHGRQVGLRVGVFGKPKLKTARRSEPKEESYEPRPS